MKLKQNKVFKNYIYLTDHQICFLYNITFNAKFTVFSNINFAVFGFLRRFNLCPDVIERIAVGNIRHLQKYYVSQISAEYIVNPLLLELES